MQINTILSYEEKSNIQNGVNERIACTVEYLNAIKSAYNAFYLDLPIPSYTNFRDALFHYVKICENTNYSTVNGNVYALNEHLQRSIKDALLRLLNNLVDWLQYFCIDHIELHCLPVKSEIDSFFPNYRKTDNWSITFFKEVIHHLEMFFSGEKSVQELNDICMSYCAEILQETDKQCIIELRKYMHRFKNHILNIRSASTALENPYSDNNEIDSLIQEITSFYEYMEAKKINYTSFFAFVRKENTVCNTPQRND